MSNASDDNRSHRERRRYKRTHVLFCGRLFSRKKAIEGLVLDLSANGARIRFAEATATNTAMTLRLAGTVDIDVEVAWQTENCLGLQFREVPARISSLFAGLLPESGLARA